MFEVVIQLGAILAVAVTYFNVLFPFSKKQKHSKKDALSLWGKILVASIPAAFVGIVVDKLIESLTGKDIDGWIYTPQVVALALIAYGILFIAVEKSKRMRVAKVLTTEDVSLKQAARIGVFQALSIVPGTSRSGSTMLGGRILGLSTDTAARFSFFLSIPAMAGGSLVKVLSFFSFVQKSGISVPISAYLTLAVASLAAFAVSMVTIRFLVDFVKRRGFAVFGIYRIVLGALVLCYFITR
jgi:undecaprenyl-diphosphatase